MGDVHGRDWVFVYRLTITVSGGKGSACMYVSFFLSSFLREKGMGR